MNQEDIDSILDYVTGFLQEAREELVQLPFERPDNNHTATVRAAIADVRAVLYNHTKGWEGEL